MAASIIKKLGRCFEAQCLSEFQPNPRLLLRGGEIILVLVLGAACAFAQAAAEYGSTTSGVAGSMSKINLMNKVKFPSGPHGKSTVIQSKATNAKGTKFINDSMIEGSIKANRKSLEAHPGKNPSKLMLRSIPDHAYVRINGKIVGQTPLLLIVAPGQYQLALDGSRMNRAEREVDLLPHETREYTLILKARYPTQVQVQLH